MPNLLINFSILKKFCALLYLKKKKNGCHHSGGIETYFSNLSTAKKLNQIINS